MATDAAIRLAVDLLQLPSRVRHIRDGALPDGMEQLLRVAVGEEPALKQAGEWTSRPDDALRKAAGFFIEQILLADGSDSYRVLGATPSASNDDLRRNMALLVRYLHPDIVGTDTKAIYANRVTYAWNDLKTPERRAAYDSARHLQHGDAKKTSPGVRGSRQRPLRNGAFPMPASRSLERHDGGVQQTYFVRLLRRLLRQPQD